MDSKDYQKRKKAKEQIKKFVITAFVWMIIIAFVSTLGVYWGDKQRVKVTRIAEINKKVYTYQPGSTYFYLLNSIRDSLGRSSRSSKDESAVNKYATQYLINYGIMYDFANSIGVSPSKETLRNLLEYVARGRLVTVPDKGLMEFSGMEYANLSFNSENGDLSSSLAPVTVAELYSYFDLMNFNVESEILYIDITNYIMSKISDGDIQNYYEANISNYTGEVYVEDLSIKNKALAYEAAKYAIDKGWENTLETYKGKYNYTDKLTLKNSSGLSKRFSTALTLKKGDILQKPQFENGEYHILKIIGFPDIKTLNIANKNNLLSDFVAKNSTNLRTKYDKDIKSLTGKVEEMAKANVDFKKIAVATGMNYIKTGKISPVSQKVIDEKGEEIPIPLLENNTWFDFLFSAKKNDVSKTFYNDDYILIIKQISKTVNSNIVYQNINQDIAVSYIKFKNAVSRNDWFHTLKSKYQYKVFDDEIKKTANPGS